MLWIVVTLLPFAAIGAYVVAYGVAAQIEWVVENRKVAKREALSR